MGRLVRKRQPRFSQTQIIAFGFIVLILVGAFLLMLPFSTVDGEGATFTDAVFTSTSASCVTGLIKQDTGSYWTLFGKIVIICLIQVGGLGFITFAVLFSLAFGQRIGLRRRTLLSEAFDVGQIGGVVRLTRLMMILTASVEGAGAILLSFRFIPEYGFWNGLGRSVFTSISAFCNAGFDVNGGSNGHAQYSSFCDYKGDWYVNLIIMSLIVMGGLGFIVWSDLIIKKFSFKKLSLHSKLVIVTTAALILGGAVLLFIFEYGYTGKDLPLNEKILTSLFGSVTPRTAGFNSVDTAQLSDSSKLLTMILMFIGGSPASTAGGIKTTSLAVLIIFAFSNMRKQEHANAFGRTLSPSALKKAGTILFVNLSLTFCAILIICALQDLPLIDISFEAFSAIGTSGMSTGITRSFNSVSAFIIVFLMYCGRVGSLSFASAFVGSKKIYSVKHPTEEII